MGGGIFKYGNPTGFLYIYFKFDPSKIAGLILSRHRFIFCWLNFNIAVDMNFSVTNSSCSEVHVGNCKYYSHKI